MAGKNPEKTSQGEICPYENDLYSKITFWQKLQIGLMSVTVAPIRLVLVSTCLLLLWPVGCVIANGSNVNVNERPISGWRKRLYPLARWLGRAVFFFASFQWLTIKGQPDPNAPIWVLAPHSSFFDVVFVVYFNYASVVARAGSDQVFLRIWAIKRANFYCIFDNPTKRCSCLVI
jgi:hypothetical protein